METHTYTHTHTQGLLARFHQLSTAHFVAGHTVAQRDATTYPKAEQQSQSSHLLSWGWGSPWMPGHQVWPGAEQLQRPGPHVGQMPLLREEAGPPKITQPLLALFYHSQGTPQLTHESRGG
jgi:hypothetical protein